MKDTAVRLGDAKIFSVLNLTKALHHILVNTDDIPKTAIITAFGCVNTKECLSGYEIPLVLNCVLSMISYETLSMELLFTVDMHSLILD